MKESGREGGREDVWEKMGCVWEKRGGDEKVGGKKEGGKKEGEKIESESCLKGVAIRATSSQRYELHTHTFNQFLSVSLFFSVLSFSFLFFSVLLCSFLFFSSHLRRGCLR